MKRKKNGAPTPTSAAVEQEIDRRILEEKKTIVREAIRIATHVQSLQELVNPMGRLMGIASWTDDYRLDWGFVVDNLPYMDTPGKAVYKQHNIVAIPFDADAARIRQEVIAEMGTGSIDPAVLDLANTLARTYATLQDDAEVQEALATVGGTLADPPEEASIGQHIRNTPLSEVTEMASLSYDPLKPVRPQIEVPSGIPAEDLRVVLQLPKGTFGVEKRIVLPVAGSADEQEIPLNDGLVLKAGSSWKPPVITLSLKTFFQTEVQGKDGKAKPKTLMLRKAFSEITKQDQEIEKLDALLDLLKRAEKYADRSRLKPAERQEMLLITKQWRAMGFPRGAVTATQAEKMASEVETRKTKIESRQDRLKELRAWAKGVSGAGAIEFRVYTLIDGVPLDLVRSAGWQAERSARPNSSQLSSSDSTDPVQGSVQTPADNQTGPQNNETAEDNQSNAKRESQRSVASFAELKERLTSLEKEAKLALGKFNKETKTYLKTKKELVKRIKSGESLIEQRVKQMDRITNDSQQIKFAQETESKIIEPIKDLKDKLVDLRKPSTSAVDTKLQQADRLLKQVKMNSEYQKNPNAIDAIKSTFSKYRRGLNVQNSKIRKPISIESISQRTGIVAVFMHKGGPQEPARMTLYANGHINSLDSPATWSRFGNILTLRLAHERSSGRRMD